MLLGLALMIFLTVALVLFILALSISAWPCGGLFEYCQSANATAVGITYDYHVIGGLLVVSALSAFFSLVFTTCNLRKRRYWAGAISAFWCFVAFAMALTAEIYYHTKLVHDWSAFLGAVAMVLSFASSLVIATRVYTVKSSPVNLFTPTHQ